MKIDLFDGTELTVETHPGKKHGILLSGGLDSAVLLYLILKDAQADLDLQIFTIPKHDGSYKFVPGILKYFNELFNISLPDTILVGDPDAYHREQVVTGMREIKSKYTVDYLYTATNQNPPRETFSYAGFKDIESINIRPQFAHPDKSIVQPFLFLNKAHIVDVMMKLNQNYLSNITHSCTQLTDSRCKVCFQCRERQWAFVLLDKFDSGTF